MRSLAALAPPLAAAVAERLFLRTRRFPVPERELSVLQSAERHRLETPQGGAVAWVWGRPAPASARIPTVFLVHGWEGRGSQLGAFVEPLRREGFRVVAFDAPGHGEAPGRSSSLPAIAAALEAAAERWGPAAGLVAHSAGAIGATYALSRGLAVPRAVFLAPGADLDGYTRWVGNLLGLGDAGLRRLRARIERRIGLRYEELEPLAIAPALTTPLFVVSDRGDVEARLEVVEALVEVWGGGRRAALRVTRGLGHRRILRDPSVVEETVGFLRPAAPDLSAADAPTTPAERVRSALHPRRGGRLRPARGRGRPGGSTRAQ